LVVAVTPASSLAGNEKEVLLARQRAIGVRLLAAGGRFHHIVAHQPEDLYVRFSWVAGGTAEAPLYIKGTDIGIFADDGRLKSVIGFVDAAPAR
jgi:hypothetical protein